MCIIMLFIASSLLASDRKQLLSADRLKRDIKKMEGLGRRSEASGGENGNIASQAEHISLTVELLDHIEAADTLVRILIRERFRHFTSQKTFEMLHYVNYF
jgi:hypothetical protein